VIIERHRYAGTFRRALLWMPRSLGDITLTAQPRCRWHRLDSARQWCGGV